VIWHDVIPESAPSPRSRLSRRPSAAVERRPPRRSTRPPCGFSLLAFSKKNRVRQQDIGVVGPGGERGFGQGGGSRERHWDSSCVLEGESPWPRGRYRSNLCCPCTSIESTYTWGCQSNQPCALCRALDSVRVSLVGGR